MDVPWRTPWLYSPQFLDWKSQKWLERMERGSNRSTWGDYQRACESIRYSPIPDSGWFTRAGGYVFLDEALTNSKSAMSLVFEDTKKEERRLSEFDSSSLDSLL